MTYRCLRKGGDDEREAMDPVSGGSGRAVISGCRVDTNRMGTTRT